MMPTSDSVTPEQSKAARALLAWSQQELATAARVGTSTVADFERRMRTPMANNAQAIKEAFEVMGLEFVAGGVVAKSLMPSQPPSLRPGELMRWITATDLAQWGERRDGQAGIPELLSRLIYASEGGAASVRFPSDESVQYSGWDGVCSVSVGSKYVPTGEVVWEIGAQRTGIRAKATGDFNKRSLDPLGRDPREMTFVFVTPQRFPDKEAWVRERKALRTWKDVKALDADDLVHWLESAPAVAQWLAVKIGRRPKGLRNLEEAWSEWAGATQTPLTPEVVLTDRDKAQSAVLRWLKEPPQLLAIQAEAPDEAVAFLFAAISPLPAAHRIVYWSRCVVADTTETARDLVGLGTPLIIVLQDPDAGVAQRLVQDGHHVFVACGPGVTDAFAVQKLRRPWKFNLQMALIDAKLSEEDAHRLVHASGRSITVLRRLMPAAPSARANWASPASPELVAAMFAGSWVDTRQQDRKILSELAGRPYEELETALASLTGIGGPLVRIGELWTVASLRDLWIQIGGQVTPGQLARFEAAFHSVLGTTDPRFSVRPKSIYYESPGEFGEEASRVLRRGLTEALIAVAVFPEPARLISDAARRAHFVVHKLLDKAPRSLWWSLSGDFRNIAEASPQQFLEALEVGLEGDDPPIMSLFRSDEAMLHPTEYLSNMLWSLEMLARSRDYLMSAALVLARLDAVDPGGKWRNRPSASLRRIFLPWFPQTYASLEERLKVIDCITGQVPAVGWTLLVALAPRSHDTSDHSAKPNWRDFTPDVQEAITWQSVATATKAIGERLLVHVKDDADRWQTLLDLWSHFDLEWRAAASGRLLAFAQVLADPAAREAVRDKLRMVLNHHRGFSGEQWALTERDLEPLDSVVAVLQPVDIEDRVRWLFRPGAASMRPAMDWQQQQTELMAQQLEAAESLVSELSTDQLFAFVRTVSLWSDLGAAIGKTTSTEAMKLAVMKRGLLSAESADQQTGLGILYRLKSTEDYGEAWVHALWARSVAESWGAQAEAHIALAMRPAAALWAEIEARSKHLTEAYWRGVHVFQIPTDGDPSYAIDRLLVVGRSRDALGWLDHNIKIKPPSALVIRAMRAAAESREEMDGSAATMHSYWAGNLLDYLEQNGASSEGDLVRLEWVYFQALRHSQRKSRTLHRALARDPQFFVDLLKLIYVPAAESGIVEPAMTVVEWARAMASQAHDVLHDWDIVPGSDDQGHIDVAALESWVVRARKLLADVGRGDIGDFKIGEILSAAKREPGQAWPPEAVREIVEIARSRRLEEGLELGVYNRRGVTVRMPHDGGEQERELVRSYRRDAEAMRFERQRTAAVLNRIADRYEGDANREDVNAEQRDWL